MNKIKRVLAVCAAFTLTCAVADFSPFAKVQTAIVASALDSESDITVNRENNDENEPVLHISGSGEVTSDDLTADDKANAVHIVIDEGITSIGSSAFYDFTKLQTVSLPVSLETIGNRSFYCCTSLKTINLNEKLVNLNTIDESAFQSCYSLESIVIPGGVKKIDRGAFNACSNLTSVVLSEGVEVVDQGAFIQCSSLESIQLPDSLDYIGYIAFSQCESLESIIIPNNVKHIIQNAFKGCTNLKSVVLPDNVEEMWGGVFKDCSSLETVNIPSSLTNIPGYTFSGCSALQTIEIPSSITSVGENAFSDCSSLTNVKYEGTKSEWEEISIADGNDPLVNAMQPNLNLNNAISGMKLNLVDDGTFDIKLYIDTWNTAFGKDSELKVTGGKQDVVTVTDLHECEEIYGRDFAVYTIDGIAMKDMADEYDVKVITTDGSTKTQTISVKDYANAILADENQDAKTKELVKRLLDLGGCAQEYFGYKTDSLVNDGLVLDREVGIADNAAVNGTSDGLKYVGSTLVLNDKIAMRHYFKQTDDYRITKHKATLNGESAAFVEKSEDLYYIEITDCSPLTYGDQSTCVIDGTQTIKYSVNDYIAKVIINSADYKLVNVVKALYHYGEAAKAYVG